MGVRNCREIGENLQIIMKRLIANDKLVNLLYYTDSDPLNQPKLNNDQKKEKVFNKLIRVIPKVGTMETTQPIITIKVDNGQQLTENDQFRNVTISIEVFVPFNQWIINDMNLRPFAILGEIQDSLNNKTINGLGKLQGGDFDLEFLTEEISCYLQTYNIVTYD